MNIKKLFYCQALPVLIIFTVVYSGSVQSGRHSLVQSLSGWLWLARSGPGQRIPQLQYLMRMTNGLQSTGGPQFSAIAAPRPISPGNSLRQICRQPWRVQPEATIVTDYQDGVARYQVHEPGYEPQQIEALGLPDLEEITDCLFDEQLPHVPLWVENVHSFPGVLSGLLYPPVRRGMTSMVESASIFTPDLILGRRLDSAFIYTPSFNKPNHYLFALGSRQDSIQTQYQGAAGQTLVQIGATPHPGACSVFHWGQEILVMTLDSVGNIVMLSTHRLLMALGWFSGECRPHDDCARPEEWDPDRKGYQSNSLPTTRVH